jgi:hypothetical protein
MADEVSKKSAQQLYQELESVLKSHSSSTAVSPDGNLLKVFYCLSLLVLKLKILDSAAAVQEKEKIDYNDRVHHDFYHKILQKRELYQFLGGCLGSELDDRLVSLYPQSGPLSAFTPDFGIFYVQPPLMHCLIIY